jgi:hypothetical protein
MQHNEQQKIELAEAVRAWRGGRPIREAAAELGISWRTLQGIEQGRGFNYPKLLLTVIGKDRR